MKNQKTGMCMAAGLVLLLIAMGVLGPLYGQLQQSGGSGTVMTANQGGTWNINNISGTVSLPAGAATAAKQPALGTAGTPSADVITVQGVSEHDAAIDGAEDRVWSHSLHSGMASRADLSHGAHRHHFLCNRAPDHQHEFERAKRHGHRRPGIAGDSVELLLHPGQFGSDASVLRLADDVRHQVVGGRLRAHRDRGGVSMKIVVPALALLWASAAPAQMAVSGNLPVTILDTAPAAQSIAALNGAASVALAGQSGVGVTVTGTWSATLTPELSFDGGTTWVATYFYQPNLGQTVATVAANGVFTIVSSGGASHARVRASAYTSGTVTASLRAVAGDRPTVTATGTDGTNMHALLTDTSGRLVLAASSGANITTATTTTVKGTAGVLRRVLLGTGVASATVKLFNVASGSCSGTPGSGAAGVITLPSTLGNPVSLELNQAFSAGICVVTSGATNLIVIFD